MVGHLDRPEAGDIAIVNVALCRLAQARRAEEDAEAAGVVTARAAGVTYDIQAIPKTQADSLNDNH